jgi:carboxyl-terminal processing protease
MNAGRRGIVRKILLVAAVGMVLGAFGGFVLAPTGEYFLKVHKGIDVFGKVFKEITANYVDEIDPEKFMQAGIEGMLGILDPYTIFIAKEDGDEVDLLTNGKYGGIGVTIGVRDGAIQVMTVMEGYSAQRQGMQPGDRIIQVDSIVVRNRRPDDVRSLTRGEPGTTVRVVVEREGESAPLEFTLIREEIQIKNITYAEFITDGVAYIKLERFSRRAGDELRQAIRELQLKGEIRNVILDLRGNPGGLLDAAVDVVSKFVPRGSLIVSTKGRRPDADKQYRSTEEPLLPDAKLVVLVDRNSASASEIVAGAVQDLDRGVVVGTRSFGKGLVQTILPLNYGAQLKITTARYYIPSGRSIQEIDYMHRDRSGVFVTVPDSLKREFKTSRGRRVVELGGITPDSTVQPADPGPMVREINRRSLFFRFANRYAADHKNETVTGITEPIAEEFRRFLEQEKFDFQEETEKKIAELKDIADRSNYSREFMDDLALLKAELQKEKLRAFDRYKEQIKYGLLVELMARTRGETGRIEASLRSDAQVETALAMFNSSDDYARKLGL